MAARRSPSLPRWRRDAVRQIEKAHRATLAFMSRLPEPEARRPGTIDRWSAKDVLAHLVSCDEETVRRLRLIARGRADQIHWFEGMADANRFNADWVRRLRRLGLRPMLRRFERAGRDVVSWLERLPADALRDSSHAYTVVDWLPTPGWTHVHDHLDEVKAWWRSLPTARRATRLPATAKRR